VLFYRNTWDAMLQERGVMCEVLKSKYVFCLVKLKLAFNTVVLALDSKGFVAFC
jgi:hypothetical protein